MQKLDLTRLAVQQVLQLDLGTLNILKIFTKQNHVHPKTFHEKIKTNKHLYLSSSGPFHF